MVDQYKRVGGEALAKTNCACDIRETKDFGVANLPGDGFLLCHSVGGNNTEVSFARGACFEENGLAPDSVATNYECHT